MRCSAWAVLWRQGLPLLRDSACRYRAVVERVESAGYERLGFAEESLPLCHSVRVTESDQKPSHRVLDAFGLDGADMRRLPGGEEVSVFGGGIVLKKVQDPEVSRWSQALLADARPSDRFRLPNPIQTDEGKWDVDGWIATEYIAELKSLRDDPAQIVQVGEHLSDVLTEAQRGDPLPVMQRQDRWAQADRLSGKRRLSNSQRKRLMSRRAFGPTCRTTTIRQSSSTLISQETCWLILLESQ